MEKARQACLTFGLPVEGISPQDALLEEVSRSAGVVRWLEGEIQKLAPEELVWIKASHTIGRQAQGQADYTEHRAEQHPLVILFRAERKHLTEVCRVTIAAGIELRRVELAEKFGDSLSAFITRYNARLGLTEQQLEMSYEVFAQEARAMMKEMTDGSGTGL